MMEFITTADLQIMYKILRAWEKHSLKLGTKVPYCCCLLKADVIEFTWKSSMDLGDFYKIIFFVIECFVSVYWSQEEL